MKTILMVLASEGFRDIEFITPRAFFVQEGFYVKTISSSPISKGRFGYTHENDFIISDGLDISSFDGVYFVGGLGSLEYIENDILKNNIISFSNTGKPIGAICAAPRVLLNWGVLKGKKITGHNWDNNFANLCGKFEAIPYLEKTVFVDGSIMTANGPEASEESVIEFMKMI